MAQENLQVVSQDVEVVRQKVRARGRRHRTLNERLAVLAPSFTARLMAFFWRMLPPRSRLRRAMLASFLCSRYDAFNRGDTEVIVAGCDPEVEWITAGTREGPVLLDEVYRGHEGVRRYFEDWVGIWDDYRVEPEEVIDTAGDRIVVICRHGGRGKGSGVEIEQPVADVFTLRNGRSIRVQTVWDPADALAQVGLSDSTPVISPDLEAAGQRE